MRHLKDVPRSRGDRHDHLDLRITGARADFIRQLDRRGELTVLLLLLEERHVIGARGFQRGRLAFARRDELFQRAVNLALQRRALQPDTRIGAALDQHRVLVARHRAHVACKHGQRRVPRPPPRGVIREKVRAWRGVRRNRLSCCRRLRGLRISKARCDRDGGGESSLLEESAAGLIHCANQCNGASPRGGYRPIHWFAWRQRSQHERTPQLLRSIRRSFARG